MPKLGEDATHLADVTETLARGALGRERGDLLALRLARVGDAGDAAEAVEAGEGLGRGAEGWCQLLGTGI